MEAVSSDSFTDIAEKLASLSNGLLGLLGLLGGDYFLSRAH